MNKITQTELGGLFELTQEARAELSSSKYYNEDLAPTSISERNWTTYNITMLWVGMSICIPALALSSSLITVGISPWMAVINVAIANVIVVIPILLNSQIGTKYGIPFPLLARLTFGSIGAQVPAILRAITACGWCAVQSWAGGGGVAALLSIFFGSRFTDETWTIRVPSWGGMTDVACGQMIGYIIFLIFVAWVAFNGIEKIKWVQNIGGPALLVVMAVLLIWSANLAGEEGYTFFGVMNTPGDDALVASNGGFVLVYMTGLMGNIAYWSTMALNIPDFSRYARSQKDQTAGLLYGMPLPMGLCAFIGAYFAQATKIAYGEALFDPSMIFYHLENKLVVLLGGLGVIAATITTCVGANVVAPANGFSNIAPKKISYKTGVIATVLLSFFVLQAWWIYSSGSAYMTWMNAYGSILAPIAAIFCADYFLCKHKRIDMMSLFQGKEGRYWYTNGVNWAAIIAWVLAFIFPLMTYFNVSGPFWNFINSINYVWSFVIGFVVYALLMKTKLAGNSYITDEEHEAFTAHEHIEEEIIIDQK